MPKLMKLLTVATVLATVLVMGGPMPSAAKPSTIGSARPATQGITPDDEVILILNSGYIQVEDPYTAPGYEPATWTSPQAGWRFVTTGDFNGDGDKEIVALGGSRAKIYDPFPVGGTPVEFDVTIPGFTWYKAAAGDIDLDGRDELILLRDDNNPSQNIYGRLVVYDGGVDGRTWTVVQDLGFAVPWLDLAMGNFIGDERKEVVLVRRQAPTTEGLIMVMNAQTGQTITQAEFGYFFHAVAAGDFNNDGRDEFVALREVISPFSNAVIMRVKGVNQGFETLESLSVGSAFMYCTAGDYDGDGAAEAGLLRNVPSPHKGLFGMDIYGPRITLNEVIAEGWTDIKSGDINADGKANVLILKNNLVRAYRVSPAPATIIWSRSGSYLQSFAVGDVDGAGLATGPRLAVTPTSLSFAMDYGGAAPAPKTISVTNTGRDTLNWTASKPASATWLMLAPTSGTAPSTINVSINTAAVRPGNYSADIVIDGGAGTQNSPQTVRVTLQVTGPVLSVSPTSLSFSMDYGNPAPPSQTLTLGNSAGTGTIAWNASVSPAVPWLSLSPTSGTTPGTITVSILAEHVQAGSHTANVVIDGGPDTGNSPFSVPVNLSVRAPTMIVSPNTVRIASSPGAVVPQRSVRVTQQGGGVGGINWMATVLFKDQWDALLSSGDAVREVRVSESGLDAVVNGEPIHIAAVDWLTIFPTSGQTPADIFLAFDTVGRPLGIYRATVIVDGGAGVINRLGWCDVTMVLMEPQARLPLVTKQR